jgi:DNA-binding NarL/FixJ family response regulator
MSAATAPSRETPQRSDGLEVAVIEDNHKYREMLAFLLENTPGFRCTGGFRCVEDALEPIAARVPDIVLIDIGLPGMSGIDGVRLLRERHLRLLVLVLTVHDDSDKIFDALQAGASGYLLKSTPPARLLEGLREAAAGGAPMSPEVASRVISIFREFPPPDRADYRLTPHEVRILRLIVEGHSYRSAAATLGVAVPTISFHLQRIYEKLHVHSKSAAVAKALRSRLI